MQLHPFFAHCVWLMAAHAKGFPVQESHVQLLQVSGGMCGGVEAGCARVTCVHCGDVAGNETVGNWREM